MLDSYLFIEGGSDGKDNIIRLFALEEKKKDKE